MAKRRIDHFARGIFGKYVGYSTVDDESGEVEHFENDGSLADGIIDGRYAGRSVIESDGRVVHYGPGVLDGSRGVSRIRKPQAPKPDSGGGGGGGGIGGFFGGALLVFFAGNMLVASLLFLVSLVRTGSAGTGAHWFTELMWRESQFSIAATKFALMYGFKGVVLLFAFCILALFYGVPIALVGYAIYRAFRWATRG